MEIREFQSSIEAVLFASGEPVSAERLSDVLGVDKATVHRLAGDLMEQLEAGDGALRIVRLEDKYQMCTKPRFAGVIRSAMDMRRNVPLSPAAMEVLAIVAYNQPVTKAFVEQVRGVDCSGVLGSLTAIELIEEKGRLELPGRPLLYGTTENFLRCFGISSPEELPPLPQKQTEPEGEDGGETEEQFADEASEE